MLLLSIIIPAYNSERFIKDTLSMLISQGLDDCEVIVVNDGSIDKTKEIVQDFVNINDSIKLISISNSGVSIARNTGMKQAAGKYIAFLDSDDTWMPRTVTYFKKIISENNDSTIFSFGFEAKIHNKTVKNHIYKKYSGKYYDNPISFLNILLSRKIYCSLCSTLFPSFLLQSNNILFTEWLKFGEDLEFIVKAFSYSGAVYYDSRCCYIYQMRDDSTTQGYKIYSIDRFKSFLSIKDYLDKLVHKYPTVSRQAYFYLANLYLANLYFYLRSHVKDKVINKLFIENKKIFYTKFTGQVLRLILFRVFSIVPIKLLLFCFHK